MKRAPGEPRPAARPRDGERTAAATARADPAAVPFAWSAAVGLVALLVYLLQCPPVSGDKDSAEFTLVLAFNGVAHPTGYPIYTLLGHPFVLLVHALGATWDYAANAWSALGGGCAMAFLHALGVRLVPDRATLDRRARFLLALLPVAFFACNPVWTYETTLAEVYSWHVAWVTGTAFYFASLARALTVEKRWPPRRLTWHAATWGFLCGVGGAHHATALFLAAPLSIALLIVLAITRRLRTGLVFTVLGGTLLALVSYGIIYWRGYHPAPVQWATLTAGWQPFIKHVTGAQYRGLLGFFLPSDEQRRFLVWYILPFLIPGLVLLLVAAIRARGPGERATLWGMLAAAVMGMSYGFLYGANDPSSYFHLPMVLAEVALVPLLAVWLCAGPLVRRATLAASAVLGLAALVLWVPWLKVGQDRVKLFVSFDRLVHSMWQSIPVDTAVVFWPNDMYFKLREFQMLDHERPGLEIRHPFSLVSSPERLEYMVRYGFDPAEGIGTEPEHPTWQETDSIIKRGVYLVESNVNAHRSLPVIHFDPRGPTLRLLRKPLPDSMAAPGTAPR